MYFAYATLRVNVCPFQGSRTIRTEEAVLISLAKLSPHLAANEEEETTKGSSTKPKSKKQEKQIQSVVLEFADEAISEESSDGNSDSDSDSD
jgi:Putative RNA methyltransferase